MSILAEWTADTFESRVTGAGMPVLVGFWATGCESCEMVARMLEQVAGEFAGRALVVRLRRADARNFTRQFGIESLPTVAVFNGLTLVDQREGVWPLWAYREMLERALVAYTV
jgi:thioredoxin 1